MTFTRVQHVRILYKTILRLHRGLPSELQVLGNNYAHDEFKRHKNCSDAEAQVFITEWANYALTLAQQLGLRGPNTGTKTIGENLTDSQIEKLRDEQVHQLYELLLAAKEEPKG